MTNIEAIRLELGDNIPEFPILSNDEYTYFIDKNFGSIRKASVDAAKTILFKLARQTREVMDIFTIYGDQAFQQYKQALEIYIKDPNYNVAIQGAMPFAGGISVTNINENISIIDNNIVDVQRAVPQDGEGTNSNTDVFNQATRPYSYDNPFSA